MVFPPSSTSAAPPVPSSPYTARLLTGNEDGLLKKIAEESGEVIMAAKDADREHLRYEPGDLMYHLLVVLARYGLTPSANRGGAGCLLAPSPTQR